MDAESIVQQLQLELACTICLKSFLDPVTLDCGHNFCHNCIVNYWAALSKSTACPQCEQEPSRICLIPNRQLANMIKLMKELSEQAKQAAGKGKACEKHREELIFFCKDDLIPFCSVCDKSEEHQAHSVIPVSKAAEEYKHETEEDKQFMVAELEELRQFLVDQENLLLNQIMGDLEKEIIWKKSQNEAIAFRKLTTLDDIIQELKTKYHQPTLELLQDVGSTLEKCDKRSASPERIPPELSLRTWDFCDFNAFLEGAAKQFKDSLISGYQIQKANVTLDPDTAHPRLILSTDRKSLRLRDAPQDLPMNDRRLNQTFSVLGCEKFTAGRHYWDITLGNEGDWGIGVATHSTGRKGSVSLTPTEGIWAVAKQGECWTYLNPPYVVSMAVGKLPKRLRVSLNYVGGRVAFSDIDEGTEFYAFQSLSFTGEPLHPFFWLQEKAHLTLSP
ncbi:zinc finger protein RFP-like isoform X2 [Rhineura floridana]|uniref:zinc finger protein RFP-like isoform X2 n=1 Tax=Rhineura floridana TaxID=261503 RepID=UPI002AC877B9|nr:zinc finger protein RFP-like isoform X2 [Rhineura floridana]